MPSSNASPAARRLVLVVGAAASLGACAPGVDRVITNTVPPYESMKRHPIVLTNAPVNLDVFAEGPAGLDRRQSDDLEAFAKDYRENGGGVIEVRVPDLGPARAMLGPVRAKLGGLPIDVRPYPVQDPTVAAPIRLTFAKLQARVPHQCGQWPEDLGGGSTLTSWENRPWWNLGCATQANLAAQVADPRDLARPRAEVGADTIKRTRGLEDLRKAKDPSTQFQTTNQQINKGVSN